MSKEKPIGGMPYIALMFTPTQELANQYIEKYKAELQNNPDDKDAYVLIGLSYLTLNDFEKSKLYLEKAYDYFADGYDLESSIRLSYQYVCGMLAFKNKDYNLAEIEFKKVIESLISQGFNRENNEFIGTLEDLIKWLPFDETFEEIIRVDSFKKILLKTDVLKKFVEGINIWQNVTFIPVLLKCCCLYYIYSGLTFSKVDMSLLGRIEEGARNYKSHDIASLIRNIENFILELGQYKTLEEIPRDKEKKIISLLHPAEAIAAELTHRLLSDNFVNLSKQISGIKAKISQGVKQPVKSHKIDTRREFLNGCDLIVKVPATYYLKGTSFVNETTVFLLNSYIYAGIFRRDGDKEILEANYASPRLHFFNQSKGTLETSFVDTYLRLDDIAERRINISNATRELLKQSSFKLWCPFAIDHPLLNLQEDISTAFALLAYCLENKINSGLKEKDWEWQEALGVIEDGGAVNISRVRKDTLAHKIKDIFKFCWLLQDITNGSACFASLVGVSGLSDLINFKISSDENAALLKERHPVKFFDMVDDLLTRGSIHVRLDSNRDTRCSALLGYTEDKKERFWGSLLAPYFYDDFKKVTLSITPKSITPSEKWPWRFEFNDGYFAIFAPHRIMKNIKEELRFMQNTWIHYDSDVFEKWPHISAKIEQESKIDG